MAEPLGLDDSLSSGPLPIDGKSPIEGMTYRELVKDLDELADEAATFAAGGESGLSPWEAGFIADAIDNPERFRTPKQLDTIVRIWEKHLT